jgi:hypothetical protein
MTYSPSALRNRAATALKGFALNAPLIAGMLFVASPVVAQGNPDPGNNNEGCGKGAGGVEPGQTNDVGTDFEGTGNCKNAVPVPLAAAGIPGLAVLGGGYVAFRMRRRVKNDIK